jgi:hypothetical protein
MRANIKAVHPGGTKNASVRMVASSVSKIMQACGISQLTVGTENVGMHKTIKPEFTTFDPADAYLDAPALTKSVVGLLAEMMSTFGLSGITITDMTPEDLEKLAVVWSNTAALSPAVSWPKAPTRADPTTKIRSADYDKCVETDSQR